VWQGFNSDSVLRKLFFWGLDFRKTETNLFFAFCPRGGEIRYEKKSSFSQLLNVQN